ncbi:gluconokinase [Lewinella sp. W8]|uniref:gluconokinase n=1 Tax=Lewinella sp. W8 TaxID=2528208 RepID=UPI0010688394|nr:gluconokinase [Lewinella sp. W8]MTB52271.1 gluconate kinase [Lewinella sp. W8]
MTPASDSSLFIGIDVGTTSVKVGVFDREGNCPLLEEEGYPLEHPVPGAAEQDPTLVLAATKRCLSTVMTTLDDPPAGVGLSCPMHSVIILDSKYQPLSPVITWADVRASAVMEELAEAERQSLWEHTGTPVHPMSPMVKLRWLLRENTYAGAHFLSDLKSFLVHHLTGGEFLLDQQLASATGLYDARAGDWHPAALKVAGLLEGRETLRMTLPEVRPATTRLSWNKHLGESLGLTGVPLFLGGSDGCLANLGSGLLDPRSVAITVGTSGAVRATHREARIDPSLGLFNYQLLDDYFVIGGATNNGGKVLEYWQQLLMHHFADVGEFIGAALSVPRKKSPAFRPYLYGERAPLWDATATAALEGLRGFHDHRHLARAVLEGVTDNLVAILRKLEAAIGKVDTLHASGGFTRSPPWLDLLAERSGRQVVEADTAQASAYGAALIARMGVEGIGIENLHA